jgi:hypothetical protein
MAACPTNQRITCLTIADCPADGGFATCTGGASAGTNGIYMTCRPGTAPVDGGEAGTTEGGGGGGGEAGPDAGTDAGGDATTGGGDASDAGGQ